MVKNIVRIVLAFDLLEHDPELSSPANVPLREELLRRWGQRLELGGIA